MEKNNVEKRMNMVTFLIFAMSFLIVSLSDLSYYGVCKDKTVDISLKSLQYADLGLTEGLRNSICVYPSIRSGEIIKNFDSKVKIIPPDYVLFYQGEISLVLFLLKVLALIGIVAGYYFVKAGRDLDLSFHDFKGRFTILSLLMISILLAITSFLILGV